MIVDRPVLVETHKKAGLYTGLALSAVLAILYVVKVQDAAWARYLPVIFIGGGILANAFAFSRANGGAVTFGQIFTSCFKSHRHSYYYCNDLDVDFHLCFPGDRPYL